MYRTHTCLFLDYNGQPDWDTYSANCLPDAESQFNRDHPGRKLIVIWVGLRGATLQHLGKMVWLAEAGLHYYQGVFQEDTTEYIFSHHFRTTSDDAAKEECMLAFQEAEQARQDEGGFGIRFIGLWRVYPYQKIVFEN